MAITADLIDTQMVVLDRVLPEHLCPSCDHLYLNPQITTCCSYVCCYDCLITRQQQRLPCPECKARPSTGMFCFSTHHELKNQVYALRVTCPMKPRGCKWTGRLDEVSKHLNERDLNESRGETGKISGCGYVSVECPLGCDIVVTQYNINKHLTQCSKRAFNCPYCDLPGTYEDIVTNHYTVCGKYILSCPYSCGMKRIERRDLSEHLEFHCPLEVVDCEFSYAGCKTKMKRRSVSRHMKQNRQKHLILVASHSEQLHEQCQEQHSEIQELTSRVEMITGCHGNDQSGANAMTSLPINMRNLPPLSSLVDI